MPTFRKRGENSTTVALIPSICHRRLVVYSRNDNDVGWAIRDFITNSFLENENSHRSRIDIEDEIDLNHSEYPPFYAVNELANAQRWELYLVLRTLAHMRCQNHNFDTTAVVAAPGDTWGNITLAGWMPLKL